MSIFIRILVLFVFILVHNSSFVSALRLGSNDCRLKYPIPHPLLSVVFTTQGGTFGETPGFPMRRNTNRLLRQLWWLSECAQRSKIKMEIVVMDWPVESPSPLREPILSALRREKKSLPSNIVQLRILEGPQNLTSYNLQTLPVLEYFGKNIAARRSLGKYILLGGTDSLPHEGIFRYLHTIQNQSESLVCFGAFRQMISLDFPTTFDFFLHSQWRDRNYQLWDSTGPKPSSYIPFVPPYPPLSKYTHWNAAGDFTLCTRRALFRIGGYVESSHRTHVDSLILRHAVACGVTLKVFHPTYSVFHQHHEKIAIPEHELSYHEMEYVRECPNQKGNLKWGLIEMRMREYLFSHDIGEWLETDCIPWSETKVSSQHKKPS
jgi:hypothetical protein